MTITKAIERLKDAKIKIKIPKAAVTARETNDALNMAIESLETENALIDRVLEIIDEEAIKMEIGGYGEVHGRIYYEHIKESVLEMKNGNKE